MMRWWTQSSQGLILYARCLGNRRGEKWVKIKKLNKKKKSDKNIHIGVGKSERWSKREFHLHCNERAMRVIPSLTFSFSWKSELDLSRGPFIRRSSLVRICYYVSFGISEDIGNEKHKIAIENDWKRNW